MHFRNAKWEGQHEIKLFPLNQQSRVLKPHRFKNKKVIRKHKCLNTFTVSKEMRTAFMKFIKKSDQD